MRLYIFSLLIAATAAADLQFYAGKITIPKGVEAFVVSIKTDETSPLVKDFACTNIFTCVAYYLIEKGISSLMNVNSEEVTSVYKGTALVRAVDHIKSSSDRSKALIETLPAIANVTMHYSDFKPLIDILWNRSHYIFMVIYPSFDHEYEIAEYTYPLYVQYCLPIIKDNYLSMCRVTEPYLFAEIGNSRAIFSRGLSINQVRSNASWWATNSDAIIPDISITPESQDSIKVSEKFKENFFSSRVIGAFFIVQHGSNIELRKYGSGEGPVKIPSLPYVVNFFKIEPNTVIFIYNVSLAKEFPVFGYLNKTHICSININISESAIEDVLSAISSKIFGAEKYITWMFSNWRTIMTILVITLIGMAIVYLLTLIKPILTLCSKIF